MTQIRFQNVLGHEIRDPVVLDRRRRRLDTVLRHHAPTTRGALVSVHRRGACYAPCEETVRLRAEWAKTKVGPKDVVVITVIPAGGGGGSGKQIGAALAMIALAIVAPMIGGAIGGALGLGSTATKLLTAGLVIGGGYLVSKLTQAKANKPQNVYAVSGGGNLPRPGERIPRLYGQRWVPADLTQPDYTIYDGDTQTLFKRLVVSVGRVNILRVRVGDAIMFTLEDGVSEAFPGCEVELIQPGNPSLLVPSDVVSSTSVANIELPRPASGIPWSGPWAVSGPGVNVTKLQIDFTCPQGVYSQSKSGTIKGANIKVRFEFAPIGEDDVPTGAWQELYYEFKTYQSQKPLRFTKFFDVPAGRYAVRARSEEDEQDRVVNTVMWEGLRGHRADLRLRPFCSEIALKIRASKELGVTAYDNVEVEAISVLPVYDATTGTWSDQATRKAVWAYMDILRNADYGGALDDSRVDAAMAAYYADLLEDRDTCDVLLRGPMSVKDAAAAVLGVLRAEPVYLGNAWSMVRDEQKTGARHVFTGAQIVRGTTEIEYDADASDGVADVIVEYDRAGDHKRMAEVRATYGVESITPRRIKLEGVSTYAHALELARWMAAAGMYRRKRVRFEVAHLSRLLSRGDRALVDVWFLASTAVAGVISASGNTLTLNRDVDVPAGAHAVLRRRDGRDWGAVKVTAGASARQVVLDAGDVASVTAGTGKTLANVLATDTQAFTTIRIGPLTTVTQAFLVKEVEQSSPATARVEVVIDHDGVWEALGETLPSEPPEPGYTGMPLRPVVPFINATVAQEGLALVLNYQLGAAPGAVDYRVEMSYDNEGWLRIDQGGDRLSGSVSIAHSLIDPVIELRAWAIGKTGLEGPRVYTSINSKTLTFDNAKDLFNGLVEWDHVSERVRSEYSVATQRVLFDTLSTTLEGALDQHMRVLTLKSEVGGLSATLEELQTTVVTETEALAAQITLLNAALEGKASASVVSGLQAHVTFIDGEVSALASQYTTLATTVGSNTSTITQAMESIDGIKVQYSLVGTVNGTTGGLVLTGAKKIDGTVSFSLEISGSLLVDGTVSAQKLIANTIDTVHLKASSVTTDKLVLLGVTTDRIDYNAATRVNAGYAPEAIVITASTLAFCDIPTNGGTVVISCSAWIYNFLPSALPNTVTVRLIRSGVVLLTRVMQLENARVDNGESAEYRAMPQNLAITFKDNPGAGLPLYSFEVYSATNQVAASERSIVVMEFKR